MYEDMNGVNIFVYNQRCEKMCSICVIWIVMHPVVICNKLKLKIKINKKEPLLYNRTCYKNGNVL